MDYPNVICDKCATAAGKVWPKGHLATFYTAKCDVCGETVTCTEPRDWNHLRGKELEILEEIYNNRI